MVLEGQEFERVNKKHTKKTRIAYGISHVMRSTETVKPDNFEYFELCQLCGGRARGDLLRGNIFIS